MVLVEEPSIRIVIEAICGKLGASDLVRILEHEGKSDLERSIARKINGWRSPVLPYFIVSRDLDASERQALRTRLLALVPPHALGRTKVRVIVPELESWYLGDPAALVAAGVITPAAAQRITAQAKFRDLCTLTGAKAEFRKIVGQPIGQIRTAHLLGAHLDLERNNCRNFHAFVEALRWAIHGVTAELGRVEEGG
ncbi:hypothetical protein DA075_21290 [Methylobacterium currus]|uniref:DUF4276 domain-containing protein n=1 Tax=Methylobacterium currus TaxID=2051553 RepID=A0A2R4WNK1_9HYPH|nr:hypothetical protein DA075_21290 [Methylobacterium currus]